MNIETKYISSLINILFYVILFIDIKIIYSQTIHNKNIQKHSNLSSDNSSQDLDITQLPQVILDIKIRGNKKVETQAILMNIKSQKGDALDPNIIRNDIINLFDLGYFSDIKVYKKQFDTGIVLIYDLKEKPSIGQIVFEGLKELKEEDLKSKFQTKLYTIFNEASVTYDMRLIEKQYIDKGYYLVKVNYRTENLGENQIKLIFVIDTGDIIRVGSVELLGNKYFSDLDIINKFAIRPYTRSAAFSSQLSLFNNDFLTRDLEFLAFYYRDNGFAKVKVGQPVKILDIDRKYMRVIFSLDEGPQYYIGDMDISKDVLFDKKDLLSTMKLKTNGLFRYSYLQQDIEMLRNKYGDLGYAFVDINPKHSFNDSTYPPRVNLDYEISKGDKVYFGTFNILGNSKTRDNVIRREMQVADGGIYEATKLVESKKNIERLGFFEEVQFIRKRDPEKSNTLNYDIKVKEKPTGQLQASIGYTPGPSYSQSNWVGQGNYKEENQSGKGWKTSLSFKWNGQKSYVLSAGFTDPRVNDSVWSLGLRTSLENSVRPITEDIEIEEKSVGASISIGRKIIEFLHGYLTYKINKLSVKTDTYIIDMFKEEGISSSLTLQLNLDNTNNYIDPTEGSILNFYQTISGGILGGSFNYLESSIEGVYFYPIDFTQSFRTFFKFFSKFSYIYPLTNSVVPMSRRYRLGGAYDLRGYAYNQISPHFNIIRSPERYSSSRYAKGGDKMLLGQLEYFIPLIQEAGIRAVVFFDIGRVYDDNESIELKGFYSDVGWGIRWLTPIAPFRFEWAYPIERKNKLGTMNFGFNIGY